jgi:hypothetical protein
MSLLAADLLKIVHLEARTGIMEIVARLYRQENNPEEYHGGGDSSTPMDYIESSSGAYSLADNHIEKSCLARETITLNEMDGVLLQ